MTTPSLVLATWSRYLGALALLGVGLDHLEQFLVDSYSAIPTIGTLFALNFASAALLAAALAAPVQRLPGLAGRLAVPLLSLAGIAVAASSLAGLLLSESTGLFGFMETGYRPAILLSIGLEATTIALLSIHLAAAARTGHEPNTTQPLRAPTPTTDDHHPHPPVRGPRMTHHDLTRHQAQLLLTREATLTAHYGRRFEQAVRVGDLVAARHWNRAYRRSALRCRTLGALMRTPATTTTPATVEDDAFAVAQ